MTYFVFPQGTPSHTQTLEARLDSVLTPPFVPGGLSIEWRQNGAIVKTGNTSNASDIKLNTKDPGDFNLDATDAGSVIDFVIDGTTFSNPVVLSNQLPTISAALVTDAFNRVDSTPTLQWTFSDADGDDQFFYRVKFGTTAGGSDLYDTGKVFSTDSSFSIPAASALAAGSTFFWTLEVGDGEKTTPTDPDAPEPSRVTVSQAGVGVVNTPPVALDVRVNGEGDGSVIESLEPTISWTFFDSDAQTQQSYRVVVATDIGLTSVLWDSGTITGAASSVVYNFNNTGSALPSHSVVYAGVRVSDTLESSSFAVVSFVVSNDPVVLIATVDDRLNPMNLKNRRPTFTWQYQDADGDALSAYEIRVSDDSANWGTDSFVGNIWHPGVAVTPEAYSTVFDEDGKAFAGCVFPKDLEQGVIYYFQVQVHDDFGKSEWFTGFFQLNNVPTATDLAIVPAMPFNNDDLEAKWTFVDDVGEVESDQTVVRWFRDGSEVTDLRNERVVPRERTRPGEEWFFSVVPHDGSDYGPESSADPVTVQNRPPQATSLDVSPARPRTNDSLQAVFIVSDPDGDDVTVAIRWYRNNQEVAALRNSAFVPAEFTAEGDRWHFTVTPTDGFDEGVAARSPGVTIDNTPPRVTAISIDGSVLPRSLANPNPIVSWAYRDDDGDAQQAYQVVIGTRPLRTRDVSGGDALALPCASKSSGIVSTARSDADVVAGDDVFDSGVVMSGAASLQYATPDFLPEISLGAASASALRNYGLGATTGEVELAAGEAVGEAFWDFPGATGVYDVAIEFRRDPAKRSKFTLFVAGATVATVVAESGEGLSSAAFKPITIQAGDVVRVVGEPVDANARASFGGLVFAPIGRFETPARDFDVLSGYEEDGGGNIKVVGVAGVATTPFPFPTGDYDVEVQYVTEDVGTPSLSLSVGSSTVLSFTYETGVATRSKFAQGVAIQAGQTIKIIGTRSGAAAARVKSVIFKPLSTVATGAKLKDGVTYYASVRAFDGDDWSDWVTTRFAMEGSAWVSSVSNSTGWTIETRARIDLGETSVTEAAAAAQEAAAEVAAQEEQGTDLPTVLADLADLIRTGGSGASGAAGVEAAPSTCEPDSFQGVRFYDGTYMGYLRLLPDGIELLADEPLEFEVDTSEYHVYRVTAQGNDIKVYVDNELAIDGTGKFTRQTASRMVEFGDVSGREQTRGSSWDTFKYSVTGAFAPSTNVEFVLEDFIRFPESSVGIMKSYNDGLYASVDPVDDEQSSMVFRYKEGSEFESRSVLAITKSTLTSVRVDPGQNGNVFCSTGKFVGSDRGLQYVFGGKPFPWDSVTLMTTFPEDSGEDWALEENCEGSCRTLASETLTIDTTAETGERFLKFSQRRGADDWVTNASNELGWTVEARVRMADDGSGGSVDSRSAAILGGNDSCDAANAASGTPGAVGDAPEDSLDAAGILVNDGRYEEVIQFFQRGIRLKNAKVFLDQNLSDQFYTVRVVGKGRAIGVFVKGDDESFFRRLAVLPDGLFVEADGPGDQESPALAVDRFGSLHAAWQETRGGNWQVFYSKTVSDNILGRGGGLFSQGRIPSSAPVLVAARPSLSLPPSGPFDASALPGNALFAATASFRTWGVVKGDSILVIPHNNGAENENTRQPPPVRFLVREVPAEEWLVVETNERIVTRFANADFVVFRNEGSWQPPIRVSMQSLDSTRPRLVAHSNGEVYVAYDNAENGNSQIHVRRGRFDPFSTSWLDDIQVTNSVGNAKAPDVAEMPNGNLVVVWQDDQGDADSSRILGAVVNVEVFGAEVVTPVVLTPNFSSAKNPRVVSLSNQVVVAFEDDGGGQSRVFSAVFDLNLNALQQQEVSAGTDGAHRRPALGASEDRVFMAWENDNFGVWDIMGARANSRESDVEAEAAHAISANQTEAGFTVTPEGQAIGLAQGDVNGNFSHVFFAGDAGMQVFDRDASGRILSLGVRGRRVTSSAVGNPESGTGGILVTGHDPDFHALQGNTAGAIRFIQVAVEFVTFGASSPTMLLVTGVTDPGGSFSDPRLGMAAAGFSFDVADFGSGSPGILDLNAVDFSAYDVVVVASDFGGWLTQAELDVLISRRSDLLDFVNAGGGLVAFAEGSAEGNAGTNPFGFLPFLASEGLEVLPLLFEDPLFITSSRGDSTNASVAVDDGGNAIVAFEDDRVREDFPSMYLARFFADSAEWLSSGQRGLDLRVESYQTFAKRPAAAYDGFGNVGLLYETSTDGSPHRIARATYDGVSATMDDSVVGYFPLDDEAGTTVLNRVRRLRTETGQLPVEVVFLAEASAKMEFESKASSVKGAIKAILSGVLTDADKFSVVTFNESTTSFSGTLLAATAANVADGSSFVDDYATSGGADIASAMEAALGFGFSAAGTTRRLVVLMSDGNATAGDTDDNDVASRVLAANVGGASVLVFRVGSDSNSALLDRIARENAGADFDATPATGGSAADFVRFFVNPFDTLIAPALNGVAADDASVYRVAPPDPGVSLANVVDQGAFDLNENGKAFRIEGELLNETGAVDLWFKPHWVSTDITERVIFGNAALDTTTANTMSFGVAPAVAGNVLKFRVVDGDGKVHETVVENNPLNPDPVRFDWAADELVHLRAVWDHNSSGVARTNDVVFASPAMGYACGPDGAVFKTEDGGDTWEKLKTGVTYKLFSLDYLDASTVVAVGEMGTVLRTTDGGGTWAIIDLDREEDVNGVFLRTSSIGYAVGSSGLILRTTDGGLTWTEISTVATGDFLGVALADDGTTTAVVAVGREGQVYRSTDDGLTYSAVSGLPVTANWQRVSRTHQAAPFTSYVVGSGGNVMSTTDAGATWTDVSPTWSGLVPSLLGVSHQASSSAVYVTGQNGTLYASADSGATWTNRASAIVDGAIRSVDANQAGTGSGKIVAVGAGGSVLLSDDAGATQRYSVTRSGNLTIRVNAREPEQERSGDASFDWSPSDNDLFFGDYRFGGDRTANATFDEVIVYKAPPPGGGLTRRRDMLVFQNEAPRIIQRPDLNKRIEWGDISENVKTRSFWKSFRMFFCGAKEPLQVFLWNAQLGLIDDVVTSMAFDSGGRLWVGTLNGITSFDAISASEDVDRFINGRPPLRNPRDRFTNYSNVVDNIPSTAITSIDVDADDNVYAGTSRGLAVLAREKSSDQGASADPVARTEREIGQEGLGTLGGGEVVNVTQPFSLLTTEEGLPSNNVLAVKAVGRQILLGTDAGLAMLDRLSPSPEGSNLDASGSAAPVAGPYFRVRTLTTMDGLPSDRVQAIARDENGEIWIGTDQGVARLLSDQVVTLAERHGLNSANVLSITVDALNRKFVGTTNGLTVVDGVSVTTFPVSSGIGLTPILAGDFDATSSGWFATPTGLVEFSDKCGDRFTTITAQDGIVGSPEVEDFRSFRLLGAPLPFGACNKVLVGVAVNGVQLPSGFQVVESVPMLTFDAPRAPSDRIDVCVHEGWRKVHDFSFDPKNRDTIAAVETEDSKLLVYRKQFAAGEVVLGGNAAIGSQTPPPVMYAAFVVGSTSNPISSVSAPSGAVVADAEDGVSIYVDADDDIQLLPSEIFGGKVIRLPSADQDDPTTNYLRFTISEAAKVYVAYDFRARSLPAWLRDFAPLGLVQRVTDMETFTDGSGREKLFVSTAGSNGCLYEVLSDEGICDISDDVALDGTPPDGCATITRVNSTSNVTLALQATDAVTGVTEMQIAPRADLTTDGETPVAFVPFASTYNLEFPPGSASIAVDVADIPGADDGAEATSMLETVDGRLLVATRNPGIVYVLDRATNEMSELFDTGEAQVLSLVEFGSLLVVGTGQNGKVFTWDGSSLTALPIPFGDRATALAVFDNTLFVGTSPEGKIYAVDETLDVQLFLDTNETSVNGFAIFDGQLYWATTNDQLAEGDVLSTTTRRSHRHAITVPAGTARLGDLDGTTTTVDGHSHAVVDGVVQEADGHSHALDGSRSGKVFRYDPGTGQAVIVHSDRDFAVTAIASSSLGSEGILFAGTSPNGRIIRWFPQDGVFIKSFDTVADTIGRISVVNGEVLAAADDKVFRFDGRRWLFLGGVDADVLDFARDNDNVFLLKAGAISSTAGVSTLSGSVNRTLQAFVRFRDAAGNVSAFRDVGGNLIECYTPSVNLADVIGGGGASGASGVSGQFGDPTLPTHRLLEVDEDANVLASFNGVEPFLSGDKVEQECGVYLSEIFNGTDNLVQWTSLSWDADVPSGASLTVAVRTSGTRAGIADAEFGTEFSDPSANDLTSLQGQFLQFRATLKVSEPGTPSPELRRVDIQLRISQAVHYFTTNFALPDDLRRGILTYNGCSNPPATDIVFGVNGLDTTDFSDYLVVTPNKVFELPPEHQTRDLRVGIKLISSPDTVPVVDEFALLFSLANDAVVRLNLPGTPGSTDGPPIFSGATRTVVTDTVQGHSHVVTFDSTITEKSAVNGTTSANAGHSHVIVNGVVQTAAGHSHDFSLE